MLQGYNVIIVDNMFTGRIENIKHWLNHPRLRIIHHDVSQELTIEADQIYHLASPTSSFYIEVFKKNSITFQILFHL